MVVGKLGRLGFASLFGLVCFACGDDGEDPAPNAGECNTAGRETDLCRVWVAREITCGETTEPEATRLARCAADWEGFTNRVAPCFVAELSECLAGACVESDDCYASALLAYDPSLVDGSRYPACRANPAMAGCEDVTSGFLKACLTRADECDVFEDLCASVAALKEPFRGQGEACLARPCEELEVCLYSAMGRTPPAD